MPSTAVSARAARGTAVSRSPSRSACRRASPSAPTACATGCARRTAAPARSGTAPPPRRTWAPRPGHGSRSPIRSRASCHSETRSGSPRNRSRRCTRSQTHSTCGAKACGGRSSAPVPCSRPSNGARSPSRSSLRRLRRGRMRPTADLPHDPRLPGLMAIRDLGLARAIPALGLKEGGGGGGGGVELVLCGYHPGARATLDARVGQRRFAVKTFADDPAPEAALYQALGAAGLAGDSGARVPPLLAWEHDLRVLVIGWLEGPTTHQLIKQGQGRRAGGLAAQWVRRTASLPVKLGLPFGAAGMMHETRAWIGTLGTADLSVGAAARALAEALARTEPQDDGAVGLVHGTLYARHILDAGDGPGVIDWHRFGQGPAELDAGMFLATLSRLRLLHPVHAGEALLAEQAFLEGTRGLLDEGALAWHRAAALLQLTERLPDGRGDWRARAHALLAEAALLT